MKFPSWSWIGWKCEVSFELAQSDGIIRDFRSALKHLNLVELSGEPKIWKVEEKNSLFDYDCKECGKPRTRCEDNCQRRDLFRGQFCSNPQPNDSTDQEATANQTNESTKQAAAGCLRFQSSCIPASSFHRSEDERKAPKSNPGPYSGIWLYDQKSAVCGALYGIDYQEAPALPKDRLEIVLLSESRRSAFGIESVVLSDRYQDAQKAMLILWSGDTAERIAVGEIAGTAWDECDPRKKFVSLL
jgi:hypothetical protein